MLKRQQSFKPVQAVRYVIADGPGAGTTMMTVLKDYSGVKYLGSVLEQQMVDK